MTRQVQLIVTGDVERLALHECLKRRFPDVEFPQPQRVDSITSTSLSVSALGQKLTSKVEDFADAIIFAADPGRNATTGSPDLVIAVDDLELVNWDRPDAVVALLRQAIKLRIEQRSPTEQRRERTRQIVRERCSFHLLVPMVEAYFFGEDRSAPGHALERAGAVRTPMFDPNAVDVEGFETADPEFLDPKQDGKYWAKEGRGRHPKRYLQFLIDPQGRDRRAYQETRNGRAALKGLRVEEVLAQATHALFFRSMMADIASGLGQELPGRCHPLTSQHGSRDRVLRNL